MNADAGAVITVVLTVGLVAAVLANYVQWRGNRADRLTAAREQAHLQELLNAAREHAQGQRQEIAEQRREIDALLIQADEAQAALARYHVTADAARAQDLTRTLRTIRNAVLPPRGVADPAPAARRTTATDDYGPAELIADLQHLGEQLTQARREAYIAEHPEYTQGVQP